MAPMQRSTSSGSRNSSTERPIGLGARIAQNIDMAKKGYEQLVHAIIRPPRAKYTMDQLGPAEFSFLGQRFKREDRELLSSNTATNEPTQGRGNLEGGATPTCSFLRLQASIWTRDSTPSETGDDVEPTNPCSPTRPKSKNVEDDVIGESVDSTAESPPPAEPCTKKTMVIYLHGNASARVEVVQNLSFLLAQVGVFGVVGIDFTGSGKSDGDWVSLGYYERVDLECVIAYLKREYGGPDGTDLEIILWGRSMGASTALMHAGKKSFIPRNASGGSNTSMSSVDSEGVAYDANAASGSTLTSNRSGSSGSLNAPSSNAGSGTIAPNQNGGNNTSILKGLICDSPFASLPFLCEELVERAREQGVEVPGVVVSVAIAMIARSVRKLANFNIREITPIEDVVNIDVPALFVVGADDDFITPQHSERLVEAYKRGVTTNLFMCPGGHNDARPVIVFEGIEEFCQQRLSRIQPLTIPEALRPTIHQNPPWAYFRTVHFQLIGKRKITMEKRTRPKHRSGVLDQSAAELARGSLDTTAAEAAAQDLGMTKDRQDDIQNKIGLMMGGQGKAVYSSDEEDG